MPISTGSVENAEKTWDSARIWLLTHKFGVLDKPNANTIVYVLKDDQNISVVLTRKPSHPTLVSMKVTERIGNNFGPKSEDTFTELSDEIRSVVHEILKPKSAA